MSLKTNSLLTLLCFLSLFSLNSFTQMENNGILVRFNHKLLDFSKIDDETRLKGPITEFLNEQGKDYMKDINCQFLNNLNFTKIFDNLKTSDSISISRHGDKVYIPPFWATFHMDFNGSTLTFNKLMQSLNNAYPLVIYAHYNFAGELLNPPSDSLFYLQQSLQSSNYPNAHVNIDSAWNSETGKKHIKVGVFDSGIDTTHPDLNVLTGHGYNVDFDTYETSWGTDTHAKNGHGTCVAGIIGAQRNDAKGVAGIGGGNGSDSTGVSLIDFRLSPNLHAENVSKAIVDASRSVGSYYDWSQNPSNPTDEAYWSNASGYGIHLGNNSFRLIVANPSQIDTLGGNKENSDSTGITWPNEPLPIDCQLCREAYLFSLKNGVITVAASGNGIFPTSGPPSSYYNPDNTVPQNYDDSWIIQVGGTGTNGEWFNGTNGMSYEYYWYAEANENLDIAAPATQALVYSTASKFASDTVTRYARFSGTSASAPHATGVAALLLSKYNQNCYSNSNLDMADVEYILEHSARNAGPAGHDDYTGYGLLDANHALKMIDFPEYQIIHPDVTPSSVAETASDTISLYLNEPLFEEAYGPIGSSFPLILQRYYRVIRKEIQTEYDFSSFLLPSTEILDYWTRPSSTSSLQRMEDTTSYNDPLTGVITVSDTFKIEPRADILSTSPTGIVTLKGYYYHFIGIYDQVSGLNGSIFPENFWYPSNPSVISPRMSFSIYLRDSLAAFYLSPCDSLNELMDTLLNLNSNTIKNEVYLYPNPSTGILKISSGLSNFNLRSIELININGVVCEKKYLADENPNTTYEFNFPTLTDGFYTVVLTTRDNQRYIKKWSKL